jgi:LacI family transcriptional regulator
VVFLERAPDCHGFNRVLVDNELGTYSATKYLIDRGHKHLAYISLAKKMDVEISRTNGFLKAIEQEPSGSIMHHLVYCKAITPLAAADAMDEIIQKDPMITGVITWNDIFAIGAVSYFQLNGRSIPDEVEVIGHDNVLAPHLAKPLSSVAMPIEEIASAAVEIVCRSQDQKSLLTPRTITLEPHLVIQPHKKNEN